MNNENKQDNKDELNDTLDNKEPKDEQCKLDNDTDDKNSIKKEDNDSLDSDKSEKVEDKEDYKQKYEEMNDKYLRAYAEFENDKRRIEKEKQNAIDYVLEKFTKDLLPCIDSLELAIGSANNKDANQEELLKALVEGVELTKTQFKKALEKNGIEEIETTEGFDPNLHNAIMQVEDKDKKDGEVASVMQKGYKLNNRVIRASMVCIVQNKKD